MHIPLGDRDAGVPRQPHYCKRIGPCSPEAPQARVAEVMQDEFLGEQEPLLLTSPWMTDLGLYVRSGGVEDWLAARIAGEPRWPLHLHSRHRAAAESAAEKEVSPVILNYLL